MSSLYKEEILMSSNDNAITLTTHRVLQKTTDVNKEIMLKDIVSHELEKKRYKYYLFLTILFAVLAIFIFLFYSSQISSFELLTLNPYTIAVGISFVLMLYALYLYFTTHENFLKLTGRFNEIEFSLKTLSKSSLHKFLNRLIVESDNRKKED